MITVTVHEPPFPPSDRMDRAERLAFVKDGYNWVAAAWPPLWLFGQQLWLALAAYAAIVGAVILAVVAVGAPVAWVWLILLGLNLMIGFEADSIMRWSLGRTGWRVIGTVVGRNVAECERRFFDDWLPQQPIIRVDATRDGVRRSPAPAAGKATGWRRVWGGWVTPTELSKFPAEHG
jgi:Protein of unknown function (DUF2628)